MMQKMSTRFVAALLLLAFCQKVGVELWLHHFLHETARVQHARQQGHTTLQEAPVHCNCLDDTMMPLIGATNVPFLVDRPVLGDRPVPAYVSLHAAHRCYLPLRGPPALSVSI
jgi:hypothetical protein